MRQLRFLSIIFLLFFSTSTITFANTAASIYARWEKTFKVGRHQEDIITPASSRSLKNRWGNSLNNQYTEGTKIDTSSTDKPLFDRYSDNQYSSESSIAHSLKSRWSKNVKRESLSVSNRGSNSCRRVLANIQDEVYCSNYENLPLDFPRSCKPGKKSKVPKTYHAIYGTSKPPFIIHTNALANPQYHLNYHNDESAEIYIRSRCGEEVAEAFNCFIPKAYRADIFRFCALYAEGGLYMDADMVPVGPFETLYSNCSGFSLGHDLPMGGYDGKQMKILASEPKHGISLCMLDSIVENVKNRELGETSLIITGPALLHKCYEKFVDLNEEKVAITYLDTRGATWPYTGMRTNEKILAYEVPDPGRHFWNQEVSEEDYANLHGKGRIYKDECSLVAEQSLKLK